MKRINLFIVCLLLLCVQLQAQSSEVSTDTATSQLNATEEMIAYDKMEVPCYTIEMPVNEDVAKDAIKKRFKQMGADIKDRKGFMEFKNVSIPEIRQGKLVDAYIHVDRKSKKEKESSIVSVIITDPGVAPVATMAREAGAAGASGAFALLSSLHQNSSDYALELAIKKQEDAVKKADKEYNNLIEDAEDLQNKLKKTQNEIEANKNKQVQQAEVVKKEKEALQQIQARRRTIPANN
jgi:hypothetical protein